MIQAPKVGTENERLFWLSEAQVERLSLAGGGSRVFTYDASGNVISEAKPGGTHAFTYDAAGRMSAFRIGGLLQASYTYDAMGRQVIRTLVASGLTIHSVFDSQGRRIAEYNEATGALIREYVWNEWEPVAVIEGGVVSFVRTDHIARPIFATNASGTKVWTASYLPFGSVHVTTGTPIEARFPGQWFQSESGLHQNWMRDYDPTTGRYLQADPLGLVDGASVYGYALQNPGRWTDPRGDAVALVCRRLDGPLGMFYSRGTHCAVFVYETECECGLPDEDTDGVVAQFSLRAGATTFDKPGNYGQVYWTDRRAYRSLRAGLPFYGDHFYYIPAPPGVTKCQFDRNVYDEAVKYSQGEYSAVFGPNSNTAAHNAITRAGGTVPDANAQAQYYGDP